MRVRKKKNTPEEKYKFVTFVLSKMKLPTDHRKTKNNDKEKRIKDKTPRDLGTEDSQFAHVVKETVIWHANGSMANFSQGQNTKRQLGRFKRPYTHGGKGELPSQSQILTAL